MDSSAIDGIAGAWQSFLSELTPVGMIVLPLLAALNLASLIYAYALNQTGERYIDGLRAEIDALNIRGRNPQRCRKIQEQIRKIECRRDSIIGHFFRYLRLFFVFGFAVPFISLFVVVSLDRVLFQFGFNVFAATGGSIVADITPIDRLLFVINEMAHVLTDALSDTFSWSWTDLSANRQNIAFGLYLAFMFRLACGGFLISCAWKALKYTPLLRNREPPYLTRLRGWLDEARDGPCAIDGSVCPIEKAPPLFRLGR